MEPEHRGPRVGNKAPNVHLLRLDRTKTTLAAYLGRPLWLNFFATWCGPCKVEMPEIQKLYLRYKSRGLLVLGLDQEEDAQTVSAFAKRFGLTFPLLIDQGEGTLAYHVAAIPESVFIDSRGMVVDIYRGQMTPEAMKREMAKLLGQNAIIGK